MSVVHKLVVNKKFLTSTGDSDMLQYLLREGRSCVRYKCGLFNTIQDVLRQRPGWVEVKEWVGLSVYVISASLSYPWLESESFSHSDGEWDFHWCDVGWLRENFDHSYMEEHVRINHFRNHYEVRQHHSGILWDNKPEISIYPSNHKLCCFVFCMHFVTADSQKPHGEKP